MSKPDAIPTALIVGLLLLAGILGYLKFQMYQNELARLMVEEVTQSDIANDAVSIEQVHRSDAVVSVIPLGANAESENKLDSQQELSSQTSILDSESLVEAVNERIKELEAASDEDASAETSRPAATAE